MSSVDWTAILAALAGGAQGLGRGLEYKVEHDRQRRLDEDRRREDASQAERRQFENLATIAALDDRGIRPASTITDRADFSPQVGAAAAMAGGVGVGLPQAQTPNPEHYTPAGSAGGRSYFFNPAETKEARATTKAESLRTAKVARLVGLKKPDGTAVSRQEAEAIVDKDLASGDVFREKNMDPYGDQAMAAKRKQAAYESGLIASREAAARAATAKLGKPMDPLETQKYLSDVADNYVRAAVAKKGENVSEPELMAEAVAQAQTSKAGKDAIARGLDKSHMRAAIQRFGERFTAKSKEEENAFNFAGGGGSLAPSFGGHGKKAPAATAQPQQGASATGNVDLHADTRTPRQKLWDEAVAIHGEAKVLADYGPRDK